MEQYNWFQVAIAYNRGVGSHVMWLDKKNLVDSTKKGMRKKTLSPEDVVEMHALLPNGKKRKVSKKTILRIQSA